jgi:hypothetical protein
MATFTAYCDFTAQGRNVSALMSLYAILESNKNRKVELTPIVVFAAFSIESYLNSLGSRNLKIWDDIERLPWKTKVEILHKLVSSTPDWGSEPLQFATEVFKLRDKLAHGKPERILGASFQDWHSAHVQAIEDELQPDWYKGITRDWATKAKDRFLALMIYLGKLFEEHESDHLELARAGVITDTESDA